MKKVGIITLIGNYNYGNRLQNYAMQEYLQRCGYEVKTLTNSYKGRLKKYEGDVIYGTEKGIKEKILKVKQSVRKFIERVSYKRIDKERLEKFKKFTKEYIIEKDYYIDNIEKFDFKKIGDEYDYFIIGSDQIWNPNNSTPFILSLATFADKRKKIAYAPSFGTYDIGCEYKKYFKKGLEDIEYLSVREEAGAKIIKELTGRKVPVVIDPTMLLTPEEWKSKIIINKEIEEKKYILIYCLGEISKQRYRFIEKVAKQRNFEIINLLNKKERQAYISDPFEFLGYINNAQIFFTDSFHGCVFSILLKTPFYILNREGSLNMNSRIDTLLSKFNLETRRLEECNKEISVECDFTHCDEILEEERKKAINYLEEALNNN